MSWTSPDALMEISFVSLLSFVSLISFLCLISFISFFFAVFLCFLPVSGVGLSLLFPANGVEQVYHVVFF